MSPAALKGFTPEGRDQLARVLRARATPAVVRPVQPELELEPWPTETPAVVQVAQDAALQAGRALRLVLPYPPGVNTLYGHRVLKVKGRLMAVPYKTHEHRKYSEALDAAAGQLTPLAGPLAVSLRLFRPRRAGDIDGPLKTLFDALNGRAWADDSQVVELHVTRHDDKHNPRVEVSITAAPPQE